MTARLGLTARRPFRASRVRGLRAVVEGAKADGAATALIFGGGGCEDIKSKGAPKRTDVTKRQSPDVPRCVTCTVGQSDRLLGCGGKGNAKMQIKIQIEENDYPKGINFYRSKSKVVRIF